MQEPHDQAKAHIAGPLTLRALTTVAVHWVPGHSLIYGNEDADLELLPNVVPMVLLTPR